MRSPCPANATRLRDGICFQARVVSARANALFHELSVEGDITPRQFGGLLTLHQRGSMTLTALAHAIFVDRSITQASNGEGRRSAVVGLSG